MDADKARKNVSTYKESTFKNFVKQNKKHLDKILNDIQDLSSEGKRELQVKVTEKNMANAVKYLQNLGFTTCVLRSVNFKLESRVEETLRITW
jgi:hypothetical protein